MALRRPAPAAVPPVRPAPQAAEISCIRDGLLRPGKASEGRPGSAWPSLYHRGRGPFVPAAPSTPGSARRHPTPGARNFPPVPAPAPVRAPRSRRPSTSPSGGGGTTLSTPSGERGRGRATCACARPEYHRPAHPASRRAGDSLCPAGHGEGRGAMEMVGEAGGVPGPARPATRRREEAVGGPGVLLRQA